MAERPFMQFYGSDFVGDTLHLSAEQIGAYMLLLIAMWNARGQLPNDDRKLARISRLSLHKWRHVWPDIAPMFSVSDDEISHKRVKKEVERLDTFSQKARENGKRGGEAKALKDKEAALAKATKSPQPKSSIVRATPEPEPYREGFSSENPKTPAVQASRFPEFWSAYPHKVGKPDAMKAFDRAAKRVDFETMMDGLARYVGKTDDRPWCNPSTWLNQDRWADQPAQVPRSNGGRRHATDELGDLISQMEQADERNAESQRSVPANEQHTIAGPRRREG